MRSTPVALDLLLDRARVHRELPQEFLRVQLAWIRSDIWNVNIDPEKHRRLTAADFLPGAKSDAEIEEEEEMREFVDRIQRGEKFEVDPAAVANFRAQMTEHFDGINEAGKVTNVGPRGVERVQRTQ